MAAQAFGQLLEALGSPKVANRVRAARELGELGDRRAVPHLVSCLRDPADAVQVAAALALGTLGDDRAVGPLRRMFQGKTWGFTEGHDGPEYYFRIMQSAATALCRIGTAAALKPLFKELQAPTAFWVFLTGKRDPDYFRVAAAAAGLGECKDERVATLLLGALRSSDHEVRMYAARSLGRLGERGSVPSLIKLLRDEWGVVQLSAAEALAELRDRRGIEPLRALFEEVEKYVPTVPPDSPEDFLHELRMGLRAKAAKGLALLEDRELLQLLEAAMGSGDPDNRLAAAAGLASAAGLTGVERSRIFVVLAEGLQSNRAGPQLVAIEGLKRLGEPAGIELIRALEARTDVPGRVLEVALEGLDETVAATGRGAGPNSQG